MGYSHVIPEQIRRIKNKSKSKVFSPTHKRAFCYIDDAIDQMLSLCSNKSFNKVIILEIKRAYKYDKLSQIIKHQRFKYKTFKGNITSGSISKRIPLLKGYLNIVKYLLNGIKKTIKWYNENENLQYEPDINKDHTDNLIKICKKKEISSYGNYPEKCSKIIKNLTASKYSTLVNTGSSALLTAFKSIGLKVGDIVITSNYTFIATLNAIKISGGEPWVFDTCENIMILT